MALSKKQKQLILLAGALVGLLALIFIGLSILKPSNPVFFSQYITAYTGGSINRGTPIYIELAEPQPNITYGAEVEQEIFSFSPSMKGKTYWLTNRMIQFVPESGEMKQQTTYKATFYLGSVMTVPKEYRKFKFTFDVLPKTYQIEMGRLESIDDDDFTWNKVRGTLTTSDKTTQEQAEACLTAKLGSKKLKVKWSEMNATRFDFVIDSIERKEQADKIVLNLDGSKIEVDKQEEFEVQVPAIGAFEVEEVILVPGEEPSVQITFSSPIDPKQNLTGLITIEGKQVKFKRNKNVITVYADLLDAKSIIVKISKSIRTSKGKQLPGNLEYNLMVRPIKPQVRLLKPGTIVPSNEGIQVPFEAVNIIAVDVEVVRIYENNVMQFLQVNELDGMRELRRTGRRVLSKTIRLDDDKTKKLNRWNRFRLDLTELVSQDPGAVYRVKLSFEQNYSMYTCGSTAPNFSGIRNTTNHISDNEWNSPNDSYYGDDDDYYYYGDYNYYEDSDRGDPCDSYYYRRSAVSFNVLASNIGLMVKQGNNGKYYAAVTDLRTAEPISNAKIEAYNYQQQSIGNFGTDSRGFAEFELSSEPYIITASQGRDKGYLKMLSEQSLSTSRFDVSGETTSRGLKGFIYGERGVWRPGDTVFLSFILQDVEKTLPADHPVELNVYNPNGQFYTRIVQTTSKGGIYRFTFNTDQASPTGSWRATISVGGTSFTQSLSIEAIKPNRLKVNLDLGKDEIMDGSASKLSAILESTWLHGAPAKNLAAKVEMRLSNASSTTFKGYDNYTFFNQAYDSYYGGSYSTETIFDGQLDANGKASFSTSAPSVSGAPGMLRANFVTRVFEPGGDFSTNTQSKLYSPYASYVGINVHQDESSEYFETDTIHSFDIATLDKDGKPVNCNLDYRVYKLNWYWWWDSDGENSLSSYVNNTNKTPIDSKTLRTTNGKTKATFRVNYPEWGRYLVYVKNKESGHATATVIYVDWPGWRGRPQRADPSGLTMLTFTTDKKTYNVGDQMTVIIPKSSNGRALVSIENGSRVLRREWVQTSTQGDTRHTVAITTEMMPNVYVHVSLIQPYAQTTNDLPIRMYGILPVMVSDKNSVLVPEIKMPDVLRPETAFEIQVSEKNEHAMSYTIAIVDEGLLDLTNFKTPNPWPHFYKREALGVRTWDMYDQVRSLSSGEAGYLLAVGGGDDEEGANSKNSPNRFKPVVKYLGPFSLKKGQTAKHTVKLPPYVGSVRTMVIAAQDGAYGKVDKTTPVRSPLMILSTLPRVAGPNEEIVLPVNIFVMEEGVKEVSVNVQTNKGMLEIVGGATQSVRFSAIGDQIVYFRLKAKPNVGYEQVVITAKSGKEQAKETIDIQVRNPNPPIVRYEEAFLKPQESTTMHYVNEAPTNEDWVKLEVSRIPSVDLSRRLDYLLDYPHGCAEQNLSKAFPQLYLSTFISMDSKQKERAQINIQTVLNKVYTLQLSDGGVAYWPGNTSANEWVTSYAGHYVFEAKRLGYAVSTSFINSWLTYQKRMANRWTESDKQNTYYSVSMNDLQQAYRLYTLALYGEPEMGAMNRMLEMKNRLSTQARWRLAATYAVAGKPSIAKELVSNASMDVSKYSAYNDTYGSMERDQAMILETLVLLDDMTNALKIAKSISKALSLPYTYSTQTTAYSLMAMAKFADKVGKGSDIAFELEVNGKKLDKVVTPSAVYQAELDSKVAKGRVTLKNISGGELFVRLTSKTTPLVDNNPAMAENLKIDVRFYGVNGADFASPAKVRQGEDFIMEVKVKNTGGIERYTDLALTQILPSGWEIYNERMMDSEAERNYSYNYQDIRDDRVLTYFNLAVGETKTITVRVQAAYAGVYYLPAVHCQAMYDETVQARTTGMQVEVIQK